MSTRWQRCVQKIRFHRRCEALRDQLLISVPRFRDALYLFSRLVQQKCLISFKDTKISFTFTEMT